MEERKAVKRGYLQVVRLNFLIRFEQGYRYLDRCGETLVKLERMLDEGWVPAEEIPSKGNLRNYRLGMLCDFNTQHLAMRQIEFVSFDVFLDQTCKAFEVLWPTCEIDRIFTPALQVIVQRGFPEIGDAEGYLMRLNLVRPSSDILDLLSGSQRSLGFVLDTVESIDWHGSRTLRRRRFEANAIRQERVSDFDERLLKRLTGLSIREREAMAALRNLRRQHPRPEAIAAQFDLETSFESDFRSDTFDLPAFLSSAWDWANHVKNSLDEREV